MGARLNQRTRLSMNTSLSSVSGGSGKEGLRPRQQRRRRPATQPRTLLAFPYPTKNRQSNGAKWNACSVE
jgi:hypothetical protein